MADMTKRARDAAGAAADRLRRVVEGSPLGGLLEEQQHNLSDLLEQVQNTELRSKLIAVYDQQQHAFVELAHTVQTNLTAQQQHLGEVLTAVEDTIKARRAKVEEADPVDDLSDDADDSDDAEPPREAPFAAVPAAKDAPADFAPPVHAPADFAPPAAPADFAPPVADDVAPAATTAPAKKAARAKKAPAKKMAPPPVMTPTSPDADDEVATPITLAKNAAAKKTSKKAAAKNPPQP
jgi:hypothetical protein